VHNVSQWPNLRHSEVSVTLACCAGNKRVAVVQFRYKTYSSVQYWLTDRDIWTPSGNAKSCKTEMIQWRLLWH